MMVDPRPGITRPRIDLVRAIQADGFLRKIRVAGPWHARSTLAVFAMAHIDHHRLGRDNDSEGTAQALGGSRHMRRLL